MKVRRRLLTAGGLGMLGAIVAASLVLADPNDSSYSSVPRPRDPSSISPEVMAGAEPRSPDLPVSVPASSLNAACPPGWLGFDNSVLHYRLCHPPGWGFLDMEQIAPRTQIPGEALYHVRLLSPELWPWSPGSSILDALRLRGGVAINIRSVVPEDVSTGCEPSSPAREFDLPAQWCSSFYSFDDGLVYSESGEFLEIRIVLPLAQPPVKVVPEFQTGGRQLVIEATARRDSLSSETLKTFWTIARGVLPY